MVQTAARVVSELSPIVTVCNGRKAMILIGFWAGVWRGLRGEKTTVSGRSCGVVPFRRGERLHGPVVRLSDRFIKVLPREGDKLPSKITDVMIGPFDL